MLLTDDTLLDGKPAIRYRSGNRECDETARDANLSQVHRLIETLNVIGVLHRNVVIVDVIN